MPLKLVSRESSPRREFTFSLSPPPQSSIPPASTSKSTSVPDERSPSSSGDYPRPPADFLQSKDMIMFGTRPLGGAGAPGKGIVKCKRCSRPHMEWAGGEHQRICDHVLDKTPLDGLKGLKAGKGMKSKFDDSKKRRAEDVSDGSPSPMKKRTKLPGTGSDDDDIVVISGKGIKKRETKKMLKEREKAERRAAKERERVDVAERKKQRATGPVDLDRQCGVINDKGLPCSRSLTCKTHTVGAKRSVEGRTRSYDSLYLDWQRTNNPNFKEPASKRSFDKDGIKRGSSTGNGNGHGDGERKSGKKKRSGYGYGYEYSGVGDDRGLEDDENGHKELAELVRATRIAGEKCKQKVNLLAIGPYTSNPGIAHKPTKRSTDNGAISTTNPGSTTVRPPFARGQSSNQLTQTTTVPYLPSWHLPTRYDEYLVGELLSKALAARTKPVQVAQHAGAPGVGGNQSWENGDLIHPGFNSSAPVRYPFNISAS